MASIPPLLHVPPFPGARALPPLAVSGSGKPAPGEAAQFVAALRDSRVGGTFWGAQPPCARQDYRLVRAPDLLRAEALLATADRDVRPILLWLDTATADAPQDVEILTGPCDPWHMVEHAQDVLVDANDDLALIAALAGKRVRIVGDGPFASLNSSDDALLRVIEDVLLTHWDWRDPFTGAPCSLLDSIATLRHWRKLIDANRPIRGAFGFGAWKQDTVEALLWDGGDGAVPFLPAQDSALGKLGATDAIALWKARVPAPFLDMCEKSGHPLYEVEDGFIRSVGLGADCVPPLSIVVDPLGAHFDPSRPNRLEQMLATVEIDAELRARARELRALIIESGISKYEVGDAEPLPRPGGDRRHILVPGQVEDDRSVLLGGGDVRGNLDLIRRARAHEPDAYILYKPHPDVLSGHRVGHVVEADALAHADAVVTDQPIGALLDMVDGVHVLTSLAGFEALLRGKEVTTHGTPFYAGWGLTRDLGSIPDRRGRSIDLDTLVAVTLLLYPSYLDPVTGLPCPPEILIARLVAGVRRENKAVVTFRKVQGNLRRALFRVGSAA
ncbi:capsular polysaccharide export protein [Sphingobium subterraneum]|uniref:Capsular polysaccharide export protein n=1 Tax=Sphingobium subterraneum TaxID=627688 RepID=A0A841J2Q9_9SPHN|nr:capsular polysaccharide export protein [Sphingobium subterraneum]